MKVLQSRIQWSGKKKLMVGLLVVVLIMPIPVYSQKEVCFPCQAGLGCPGCSHWMIKRPLIFWLYDFVLGSFG